MSYLPKSAWDIQQAVQNGEVCAWTYIAERSPHGKGGAMPDRFQQVFQSLLKSGMLVSEARAQALHECCTPAKRRTMGLGSAQYRAFAADKRQRAKQDRLARRPR